MKTCRCGRLVSAGRTSPNGRERQCLICQVADDLADWHRPVHPRKVRPPRQPKPPSPRAEKDRRYYLRRKVRQATGASR